MRKSQQIDFLKVLAFTGDDRVSAKGNVCCLYVYSENPNFSDVGKESTRCHTWFDRQENAYFVECFNDGKLIACCGHGLLSAAYYWMHKQRFYELNLQMNDTRISAYLESDTVWLRFPRVFSSPCEPPVWLGDLIANDQSIAASTAGDDNDYLIVQWPDNYPLESLLLPGKALAKFTQRAVIYTAKYKGQAHPGVSMQFRYFAPQYGVDEDDATGSAMRVLADYWAELIVGESSISALQVSPSKGLLKGRVKERTVEIGGFVSLLEQA